MSAGELLPRERRRGAQPRPARAGSGCGERLARVGDAAAEDDTLDVVGHDQQMDRPGQPAADVVDELDGEGVAAAAAR